MRLQTQKRIRNDFKTAPQTKTRRTKRAIIIISKAKPKTQASLIKNLQLILQEKTQRKREKKIEKA